MSSSNESYFIHIEESQDTIPQIFCPHECFLIKLYHFHSTSFNTYSFLIPSNILCDYDEFESVDSESESNTFLRDIFSSVPIPSDALDQTLLLMGDYARHMIRVNFEGYRILEMDVLVNENGSTTTLEKVKLDEIGTTCSMEQCAICLEEFCCGLEEGQHIVRTKCMHLFHEQCIARWLKQCGVTNREYSCPLCRSQIQ